MQKLDRLIPNRSATKFDYLMAEGWKRKVDLDSISQTKVAYQRQLREVFILENTRIFAYKNKPPRPVEYWPQIDTAVVRPFESVKPQRHVPQAAERTLDASKSVR